ncbi:DUF4192 domain-containing protein [Amycolatopsis sp. K13G38]|uniref:DUF4192 domain-containing protein n=1 Tax=Amycolatopsis acididurans TaxID=2724524 RepID=A0ABX1IZM5_9PSEU|nr:DUF4192 domain-containing protein [Amycolatopsis acididurans]NKQ52968.1 DUF4192 domain-containing protein [Amycolatopsis acididurans]
MTTTTTKLPDGRTRINISDPAQLIAAIPCLLGFCPENSIVLIGLSKGKGTKITALVRVDLPAADLETDAVEAITRALCQNPGEEVLTVVIGRHPDHPPGSSGPPHSALVRRVAAAFHKRGRKAGYAAWVPEIRGGARWRTYRECAPDNEGVLPEPASTVMAAVCVAEGLVTFDSRAEMEKLLEPDDPLAHDRRARLLDTAVDALAPDLTPKSTYEQYARIVRAAIDQVRRDDLSFTDEKVVRLALALSNPLVRDSCLRTALPQGSVRSRYARRLWLELVRLTPPPERAEAAALLCHAAYLHGEGSFAIMAAENALDADPSHPLASLLHACLTHGLPPDQLQHLTDDIPDLYRPRALQAELSAQKDP